MTTTICTASKFLSTLSLRRATAVSALPELIPLISIHALLAESDFSCFIMSTSRKRFLSTLSLRRATSLAYKYSIPYIYFYPRSPCGERLNGIRLIIHVSGFLSTLSLRRATHYDNYNLHCVEISIHALLAESDTR